MTDPMGQDVELDGASIATAGETASNAAASGSTITWNITEPVSGNKPVSMSYTVKLSDKAIVNGEDVYKRQIMTSG